MDKKKDVYRTISDGYAMLTVEEQSDCPAPI